MSNFLDPSNPKSKYLCKNELIYIRDVEGVQKTRRRVLPGFKKFRLRLEFLNLIIHSCSFFKQYIMEVFLDKAFRPLNFRADPHFQHTNRQQNS